MRRDIPPNRCFGDPCADHLAFETQILRQIHPSQFGYPDAMVTQFALIVCEIETGFTALFALEARAASPAFKEGASSPYPGPG
jgi:hypothetical protein